MKVKELIKKLKEASQDAEVYCEYNGGGGCDTCGYGSETESEVISIVDNETRVVLSVIG